MDASHICLCVCRFNRSGVLFAFSLKPYDIQKIILEDTDGYEEYNTNSESNSDHDKNDEKVNTFVYSRPVGSMYEGIYNKLNDSFKKETHTDQKEGKCYACSNFCAEIRSSLAEIFFKLMSVLLMYGCTLGLGGTGLYILLELWDEDAEVLDCFSATALQAGSINSAAMGFVLISFRICEWYFQKKSKQCMAEYDEKNENGEDDDLLDEILDRIFAYEAKIKQLWGYLVMYMFVYTLGMQVCGYWLSADVFAYTEDCVDLIEEESYLLVAILNWNVVNAFLSSCLCCTTLAMIVFGDGLDLFSD